MSPPFGSARAGVVSQVGDAIPDSELNHRYPTDEGSGSTVGDELGSVDFDTNANWVTGSGGKGDAYLDYNASSNHRTKHVDSTNTPFDNVTQTWMGWLNPDSIDNAVLSFQSSSGSQCLTVEMGGVFTSGDHLALFVQAGDGGSDFSITTSSISTGSWQFWAFVLDDPNTTAEFYFADQSDTDITKVGSNNYDSGLNNTVEAVGRGATLSTGGSWDTSNADMQDDHPACNVGTALPQSTIEKYFDATKGNY